MTENAYACHHFDAETEGDVVLIPQGWKVATGDVLPGDRVLYYLNDLPVWRSRRADEGQPVEKFDRVIRREKSLLDACLGALEDARELRRSLRDVSPDLSQRAANVDAALADLMLDWIRYANEPRKDS